MRRNSGASRATAGDSRPRVPASTAAWRALARVVQCECDRSNGTLYLMHMTDMSRVNFKEQLAEVLVLQDCQPD